MKNQTQRDRYRGKISRFTEMPCNQRHTPAVQLINVKCLDTGEIFNDDVFFLPRSKALAGVFIGDVVDFDASIELKCQSNRYARVCTFKRPTKLKLYPLGGVK